MTPGIFIKNIIDSFTWMIFFFIIVLTGIVFISQKSVPGDSTYGVKLGFEKALVRASKVINSEITVQIELTKRRAAETQKVIASTHATESLNNLSQQVSTTEQTILTIQDPQKQQEAAVAFIKTLTNTQDVLETEKQQIQQTIPENLLPQEIIQNTPMPTNQMTISPTITQTTQPLPTKIVQTPTAVLAQNTTPPQTTSQNTAPSPTFQAPSNTPIPPTPIPIVTQPSTAVTNQITQTQEHIEKTIERLSKFETRHEKEEKNTDKENKDKIDEDDKREKRKNKRD